MAFLQRHGGHGSLRTRRPAAAWVPGILLTAAGLLLVAWGMGPVLGDMSSEGRYERLADDVVVWDGPAGSEPAGEGAATVPSRDWTALREANPDVVAWVRVEGTPIDYPVMGTGRDGSEDFYLSHDFWREASGIGCPTLAAGSSALGRHALVYGHHWAPTDKMFSTLAPAWRQDAFDGLGACTWETPGRGVATLRPLCALSVDMGFEDIQTYGFADAAAFQGWLQGICEGASAKAAGWEEACAAAERIVTLVTCTSPLSGQAERTLVLFAG